MVKKIYVQPRIVAVPLCGESIMIEYSKAQNGCEEAIKGIREENETTDIELN